MRGLDLLLEWIAKPESIALAGARAHALLHWLTPSMCRYKSLEEIGKSRRRNARVLCLSI